MKITHRIQSVIHNIRKQYDRLVRIQGGPINNTALGLALVVKMGKPKFTTNEFVEFIHDNHYDVLFDTSTHLSMLIKSIKASKPHCISIHKHGPTKRQGHVWKMHLREIKQYLRNSTAAANIPIRLS